MYITIDMVLSENPCPRYTRETLETLAAGRESLTPSEVAGLDIPIQDRLWILSRFVGRNDPTRIVARRIARDALGKRKIPEAYQLWLDSGNAHLRSAAWYAVWSASWYTARDAARDAAWNAARDAALDAAWAVAWDAAEVAAKVAAEVAAEVAARDAARAAAQERYLGWMVEYLENIE